MLRFNTLIVLISIEEVMTYGIECHRMCYNEGCFFFKAMPCGTSFTYLLHFQFMS